MKRIILFLSLSFSFAMLSHASIIIEIDGVEHSCLPASDSGTTLETAATCANEAYRGLFSRDESLLLCGGARSNAPANCAIEAYRGPFSKEESIAICISALTTGPSECAILSYRGPFSKEGSIKLCSSPRASQATAECAIEAYRGPYSKEEAINLCKLNRHKSKLNFKMSKDMRNKLVEEANLKAFSLQEYK